MEGLRRRAQRATSRAVRAESRIVAATARLRAAGLWREPHYGKSAEAPGPEALASEREAASDTRAPTPPVCLDTRSNDYLGFACDLVSRETVFSSEAAHAGAGASRLVSGTAPQHLALERAISQWLGAEASLSFASAYAANTGAIAALAEPGDLVLSDALNHASIIDGCRLSRAEVRVVPHLDIDSLSRLLREASSDGRVSWVVTESYFGMDADSPDLLGVHALCKAHGAGLLVDETHALGVFGPAGRGLCAEAGIAPDLLVGGFGKAFGLQGGFVAGSAWLVDWLWNRARSFVFSTALSPALAALATANVARVRDAEPLRAALQNLETRFSQSLASAGIPVPERRHGPIFPVLFGSEARTLSAAATLSRRGFVCQPIRPPTVPPGTSRLRVNLRASMTEAQVDALAAAIIEVWPDPASVDLRDSSAAPLVSEAEASPGHPPDLQFEPITSAPRSPPSEPQAVGSATTSSIRSRREALTPGPLQPPDELAARPFSVDVSPAASTSPRGHELRAAPRISATSSQFPSDTSSATSGAPLASARPTECRPPQPRQVTGAQADTGVTPGGLVSAGSVAPPRAATWIVLGTGTGIGKTFVGRGLLEQLRKRGQPCLGLKPIETGFSPSNDTDAACLTAASFHVKHPHEHPLYAFRDPIAPALAARRNHTAIDLPSIAQWVARALASACPPHTPDLVVEMAGGVFSPLSPNHSNFDLALALGPAHWVLVAPDRLGVLHDVQACLIALRSLGRAPDCLVLSAPSEPDASSGTNAGELTTLEPHLPVLTLPRGDTSPLAALLALPMRATQPR